MNKKVVLASSNQGKLKELQNILSELDMQLISQSELHVPDVAETGLTFVENALIKARHASAYTGLPAIADDSGIEVKALNGRPGIYSARYAGDDKSNNEKLLAELVKIPEDQRQARFVCLIVYLRHSDDATPIIAQGIWNGMITREPRGGAGFGYDPLFFLPECQCTSAELSAEEKNKRSHRGQALRQLVKILQNS